MEIPNTFIVRQPTGTQASDDLDFAAYWQAVKRRFVPAAGVGASVIALSIVAIALQRPAYESAGKLLIRPDKTPSLTGLSPDGTREFEPITVQSNPLKTEIEVLQSQPLPTIYHIFIQYIYLYNSIRFCIYLSHGCTII